MTKIDLSSIFARRNRGILFDLLIFLLNVALFGTLSARLQELIDLSRTEDYYAKLGMAIYLFSLCILPGFAAFLKFFFGHRRPPGDYEELWGGMFKNALAVILIGQVLAFIIFFIVGAGLYSELREMAPGDWVVAYLLKILYLASPVLAIAAPVFVYLYFSLSELNFLPKFVKMLKLEIVGDFSILINLILYQAFWGILAADLTKDYQDIPTRISTLAFTVVVIYLPPRIFFLAEDAHRPLAWLTILLANLPLILRIVFF